MTCQHRLVLETVTLVKRAAHRRGIEADGTTGGQGVHGRFQQTPAYTLAAMGRIDQHHRNPAEGAVVYADRRADDAPVGDGSEAACRRLPQQHAPVVQPLIPAGRCTQRERGVEVVNGQQADVDAVDDITKAA